MPKDYYASLGVSKWASEADIKKAYKKKAMEHHPDRNVGDKKSEAKFKEINEAYQTLGDTEKRKSYDQFWSAEWSPFGNSRGNPFSGGQQRRSSGRQKSGGFEDIFSQFGGGSGDVEFDIGDLFGRGRSQSREQPREEEVKKEIQSLDVVETIEIPFFDFLYDTTLLWRPYMERYSHSRSKLEPSLVLGSRYHESEELWMGELEICSWSSMPRCHPYRLIRQWPKWSKQSAIRSNFLLQRTKENLY